MNPSCFVCSSPATLVCRYSYCSSPPFRCEGPCLKGISQKLHMHEQKEDLISFQEFQKKLLEIKSKLDPHSFNKEYLEETKKNVKIAKDNLQQQINNFDKAFEELEKELHENLRYELTEEYQALIKKIQQDINGDQITGNDLLKLFEKEQQIFMDEKAKAAAIKQIKKDFEVELDKIINFKADKIFMGRKERLDKSKVLYDQGVALKVNKKWEQALQKFNKALKINDFDFMIHFQMGKSYAQLNRLQQAELSFACCLNLNQKHLDGIMNMAHLYQRTNRFQQAMDFYSQVLQRDETNVFSRTNRGFCFSELKQEGMAILDYQRVLKIQPKNTEVVNKIQEATKLMIRQCPIKTFSNQVSFFNGKVVVVPNIFAPLSRNRQFNF